MRPSDLAPRVHVFVCTNRRAPGSPLGTGCSGEGEALYDALKREVARRGAYADVWITATACMGVCPKQGATVSVYPEQRVLTEVMAGDAERLIEEATAGDPRGTQRKA